MIFTVNNHLWQVLFVPSFDYHLQRDDGSWTIGMTDGASRRIYIMRNLSYEMQERVLCHELCHTICIEHNIALPIEIEERLCNFMADYGKEIIYLLDDLLCRNVHISA